MRKQMRVINLLFFTVFAAVSCNLSEGASINAGAVPGSVDVTKIETDLKTMRKTLDSFPVPASRKNINLQRDPFEPFVYKERVDERGKPADAPAAADEKKQPVSRPAFNISGIIYGVSPLVIIGNDVKAEGEFINDYHIYKIYADRVLIKYGDAIFPFEINQ